MLVILAAAWEAHLDGILRCAGSQKLQMPPTCADECAYDTLLNGLKLETFFL